MRFYLILTALFITNLVGANEFEYYKIDRYKNDALLQKDIGGLYVNTVLADSTNEFYTYRVYQDGSDFLGRSCRSIEGIEELPPGFYEIRFPFNHLAYPPLSDIQVVTGFVTVIDVFIASRAVLYSEFPALTFNLYNRESGENVGKNQKVIYATEKLSFDLLPGKYRLIIDNIYEDPRNKPEEELEDKIEVDFDLKAWQTIEIQF